MLVVGESKPVGEGPLVECELPLGRSGLIAHDELLLSGWAASPKGIAGVAVQIGERQWNASYGLDTPSLAERLSDVEGADRAGYRLTIDTSDWEPGPRVVTVAAFDREGGRSAVEGAIDIRPFGEAILEPTDTEAALQEGHVVLALDSPSIEDGAAEVEGALDIRGWAWAREGVEAVLVTIDGSLQYEALRPIARPDLLRELGAEVAGEAGFALRVDPLDCPPGRHTLTVSALTPEGRAHGVECELSCRATRDPASLSAAGVDSSGEQPPPRLRADGDFGHADEPWRSRALVAEADAALCRAEARLARNGEERALRRLRTAEDDGGAPVARLRAELAATRESMLSLRQQADGAVSRLAAQEESLSWRLTRPLRAARQTLRSRAR